MHASKRADVLEITPDYTLTKL